MPIEILPSGGWKYTAPDPTEAQIRTAEKFGFDAYSRLGICSSKSPLWDMSATHPLAASATIHDIRTQRALSDVEREVVDSNFDRDCHLLANALDEVLEQEVYDGIGYGFSLVVDAYRELGLAQSNVDRTDPMSDPDDMAQLREAESMVNWAARYRGKAEPYAEVANADTQGK